MSDESTASLRIKYESIGADQLKRQAAEVKAASIEAAKTIVANSTIVKQATLADIKIESAARVAAVKNAAALQILEVKKANALELMERRNAAAQAISLEKTKQKEIAAAQKPSSSGFFSKDSWAGYVTGINQAIALTQRFGGMLMGMANNAAVWDSYRIALETMEGGARQAERAIADLYVIAKAPGIDQEGAQRAYLQFRALNIEGGKAKEMIKTFANAIALGGGSSIELNRVNIQMRQMLANNRVLESDLRFMKESMPMLAKVMQDTFGTSTAEGIRNLGLSAGEFIEGILVGLEKLPKAQQNLKSEIENTANAWSLLKAAMIDTEAAGKFFDNWTKVFENLTALIKAKSVNWKKLIGDSLGSFLKGGLFGNPWAEGVFSNSDRIDAAIIDPIESARAKINATYDKMAKEAAYSGVRLTASGRVDSKNGMTREEALAAFDRNNPTVATVGEGITDLGDLPKGVGKGSPGSKKLTNPLDVVGDKRYLSVDKLQGRNLLEAQAAIDKALMAERDKANKEAEKQRETEAEEIRKEYEEEGKKLLAIQQMLNDLHKADVDKVNADNVKANQDRIQALQELRKAEAGEYQLRLIQLESWGEQMKARVGNDEAAISRIMEVQADKRREIYADAWVNILGNSSNFFGSMANLSRQFDEDNTREYAKWVAIQQSLAIVAATINISVAMSKALASGFTTLDGLAQMATVAAAGGQILSSIAAMNAAKVGKGAFDKGGSLGYGEWGIAGENGAEIVEGPARITSTRDTARALAGKSSVSVNVHNYAGANVDVQQRDDGSIDVIVDKIASQLEDRFASNIASGTGSLNKAVRGTYGLRRSGR